MYVIKQIPDDFLVEELFTLNFDINGNYNYYLLTKKEYNTQKVIQILSDKYKLPIKYFGYAGTKDKNAITKQYISIKAKIKNVNLDGFSIKKVGEGNSPISLGDHFGNRFEIIIRNIKKIPSNAEFTINYFDDQRFGKFNLEIGLAILKKDFKKAASLIDLFKIKDYLLIHKNDYIGAIRLMPFKILKLYIHSVQSYLWNEFVCNYIKIRTDNFAIAKYKHGKFFYPKNKFENISIPLIAFDTEFTDKNIEQIYLDILKKNNLSLRDFVIRAIPGLTPLGAQRDIVVEIKNFNMGDLDADELNKSKKKIKITFDLQKGCYATNVIKQLFSL